MGGLIGGDPINVRWVITEAVWLSGTEYHVLHISINYSYICPPYFLKLLYYSPCNRVMNLTMK